MMLKVGLTGGIGSGKSTVAKMFEQFNVPVYYTDAEAKKLMITSKIIKRKLLKKFGETVYVDGVLNKPLLASLIFTNKENLLFVNSVVHPKVNQHFNRWVKKQSKMTKSIYVLQENAILFENESHVLFDFVITVTAPIKVKIKRVIQRDNTTEQKVLDRMNNQWSDEQKIEKSKFVINNVDLEETRKQVYEIHQKIMKN